MVEGLAEEHADAQIALRFRSDLELLVSVMLSAQTTDTNVNRVTACLFRKYPRPEDYLAVPREELERDIYATGFFRQKAKAIRGTMRVFSRSRRRGAEPPRELADLPGVARKTANVVAAELGQARGTSSTHTFGASHSGSGSPGKDEPGEDRARRADGRLAADWARFPHSSSGTAVGSASHGGRSARTAFSRSSAPRPASLRTSVLRVAASSR